MTRIASMLQVGSKWIGFVFWVAFGLPAFGNMADNLGLSGDSCSLHSHNRCSLSISPGEEGFLSPGCLPTKLERPTVNKYILNNLT